MNEPNSRPRVAYFVRKFPVLSQTFVVGEITNHLEAGLDVKIYSLRPEEDADFSANTLGSSFRGRVEYLNIPRRTSAMARELTRGPLPQLSGMRGAGRAFRWAHSADGARAIETALLTVRLAPLLQNIDVLHCHFGDLGRLCSAVLSALKSDVQLITTFHAFELTRHQYQPLSKFYAGLFRSSAILLPISNLWRHRLLDEGASSARTHVHHMGIDTTRFSFRPHGSGTQGSLRLAMVGRLSEKKGHEVALSALAHLRQQRPDLHLHLSLVGGGPLENSIRDRISELALADVVDLLGPLDHQTSLDVVIGAEAFLLPSLTARDGDMEGIPVALMEAMASGRPVISSRHSGIPELVDHGRTGLLAQEGDALDLADCIARLADDLALRRQLAVAARAKVETEFDAEVLGSRLRQLYQSCLRAPHGTMFQKPAAR